MRAKEIFERSPGQYGGGAPSMSAQRITAPPISTLVKNSPTHQKGLQRTQDFNALATAKEKFDFIYKLQNTNTKLRIAGAGRGGYRIQSYNPATGDISLLLKTSQGDETVTGNTNDFTYQGRSQNTGGGKTYTFVPGKLTVVSTTQPQQTDRGRPMGTGKKQYDFPTMPW